MFTLDVFQMKIAFFLGKKVGRVETVCLFELIGIVATYLLLLSSQESWGDAYTILFYVLRQGFIKSTDGITKGLIMQQIPRDERGKWASYQSALNKGTPVAALLGGWIADRYGLLRCFEVSMAIQLFALIPLSFLHRSGRVVD